MKVESSILNKVVGTKRNGKIFLQHFIKFGKGTGDRGVLEPL